MMLGNDSVPGEYITMAKTHVYYIYGITQLEKLLTKVSNVIIQWLSGNHGSPCHGSWVSVHQETSQLDHSHQPAIRIQL